MKKNGSNRKPKPQNDKEKDRKLMEEIGFHYLSLTKINGEIAKTLFFNRDQTSVQYLTP